MIKVLLFISITILFILLFSCSSQTYPTEIGHIHPHIEKCPKLLLINESNNMANIILDNTSKYYLCSKQVDILIEYYQYIES